MNRTAIVAAVGALVFAGSAVASPANPSWTLTDMKAAVRAVGYPKPHPVKLGCKGLGAATSAGYTLFRCTARYRHQVRRRFFIEGQGEGGWLCAGKTLDGCTLLRRGFVTNAQVTHDGSVAFAAQLASRGYMANVYQAPQPYVGHGCPMKTAPIYSFCYAGDNNTTIAVNITMRKVKTGYTFTGDSTIQ